MYNSSEVWAKFENEGSYKAQLQDPRWKELRKKVIDRDGGRCQMCYYLGGYSLHVHHKIYIKGKRAWEHDMELLISVCAKCHSKHHGISKKKSPPKKKKKSKKKNSHSR
jgi:5-methylcytosine-specific restriction endonuclease McrA